MKKTTKIKNLNKLVLNAIIKRNT